ncbi:protein of unknown function [Vibrio tapetis subsp. tapetis]|uniref:Uncharacterized protein n=1 Tax=Vibrio tapetis subsp. tapetis TaxID=1671868 RepID=A0A2N8ZIU3_9VIBR|nr:protein of unknown function [Vibrio tapetis subsp. tapetis]
MLMLNLTKMQHLSHICSICEREFGDTSIWEQVDEQNFAYLHSAQ